MSRELGEESIFLSAPQRAVLDRICREMTERQITRMTDEALQILRTPPEGETGLTTTTVSTTNNEPMTLERLNEALERFRVRLIIPMESPFSSGSERGPEVRYDRIEDEFEDGNAGMTIDAAWEALNSRKRRVASGDSSEE